MFFLSSGFWPAGLCFNPDGLSLRKVCQFGGCFPGWVLEWKLRSGFPTLFSQQLEDTGCSPLSLVNRKAKPQSPGQQDKHTLLPGGQPHAACKAVAEVAQGAGVCFPRTELSFMLKAASPQMHPGLAFKGPLAGAYGLRWHLDHLLHKHASLTSQQRDLICPNPLWNLPL